MSTMSIDTAATFNASQDLSGFAGRTALVTGASSGIGLATARALLAQGAHRVYLCARDADRLAGAAAALGERAVGVVADVASLDDLARLRDAIAGRGDRLDLVFANAGVAHNNRFGETGAAAFAAIFDTNVRGVFFTVQTMLPLLNDGASVVLNASVAATKGMPDLSLYNASKAAVRSFARSWASDLKARRIRVNSISPGITRTPILSRGLGLDADAVAGLDTYLRDAAPAGRIGEPEDSASAVLFLASAGASYINGADLPVDGGFAQI